MIRLITREFVHGVLGISESWEMPEKLLSAMLDAGIRADVLQRFAERTDEIEHDGLTDYFQSEHGDRDALKQDFTPPSLCDIVAGIAGEQPSYLDACAGTGGLTISLWARSRDALFRCEEYSARTVPALLLNMSMRNMRGEVVRKDVLTGETFERYVLTRGERFSDIRQVDSLPDRKYAASVQNPPYSLKWDGMQRPWMRYGAPPKSKGDYAFLQYGMANVEDGGKTVSILPHGVLFRGAQEGAIRAAMLRDGVFRAVIGMPDRLFLHTGIPVAVLVMQGGADGSLLVVNADELFEKDGKLNVMREKHVDRVLKCCESRQEVPRLAHVCDAAEVERNGYNLNIPRYVDRYEEPVVPDVVEVVGNLASIDEEIRRTEVELMEQVHLLVGTTPRAKAELRQMVPKLEQYVEHEGGQMAWAL